MVLYLFYQDKSRMVIKIVAFLIEVLVEHEASRARYIIPVGIKPEMCWGFRFPHVLVFFAFDAVAQIYIYIYIYI